MPLPAPSRRHPLDVATIFGTPSERGLGTRLERTSLIEVALSTTLPAKRRSTASRPERLQERDTVLGCRSWPRTRRTSLGGGPLCLDRRARRVEQDTLRDLSSRAACRSHRNETTSCPVAPAPSTPIRHDVFV